MVQSKRKLLRLLEGEALRRRALAKLAPELEVHHLETARALESAWRIVNTPCRFKRLKGRKP